MNYIDYNAELDKLFEDWRETFPAEDRIVFDKEGNAVDRFTPDGLMRFNSGKDVNQAWHDSPRRVMFLLKDAPEDVGDVRDWMRDMPYDHVGSKNIKEKNRNIEPISSTYFMPKLAYLLWGLLNAKKPEDCSFELAKLDDVRTTFNSAPYAIIETKKLRGGRECNDKLLKTYLNHTGSKKYLKDEICNILRPNIVYCSNVLILNHIKEMFPADEIVSPVQNVIYHSKSNMVAILGFHPSRGVWKHDGVCTHISLSVFYDGVMHWFSKFLATPYGQEFLSKL